MSFESIIHFMKEVSSLGSLIASIAFDNLFGVENLIHWASERNIKSRIVMN